MESRKTRRSFAFLPAAAAACALAVGGLLPGAPAHAVDLSRGDVSGSLDITLTQGASFRAEKRDDSLTGENSNDGDTNYRRGLVGNVSSVAVELELARENLSFFARAHGFVDFENRDGKLERTELSDDAKDIAGGNLKLLDLYVAGAFEPDGRPLDVRAGNQVLNWGESTFIPNGVNVVNPFDVTRLRTPGSELRDALVPVPMLSAAAEPVPNVSVEGFYQFLWAETEIDPVGTYFSTNDYVGPGGRYAYITHPMFGDVKDTGGSFGPLTPAIRADLTPLGVMVPDFDRHFLAVPRNPDREPRDDGQWGVALRLLAEELNATEFGLYFANTHSRLPLVTGRAPTRAQMLKSVALAGAVSTQTSQQTSQTVQAITQAVTQEVIAARVPPDKIQPTVRAKVAEQVRQVAALVAFDDYIKKARYFAQYPEDLRTMGVSFNTAVGTTGWALQGEYSFRPDAPLQRLEDSLFEDGLRPLGCFFQVSAGAAAQGAPPDRAAAQALASCAGEDSVLGKDLQGYIERDVSQAQVTATRLFGSALGSDSTGLVAEAAVTYVHDMPEETVTPLDTAGAGSDTADGTSWGYRGAVWLDYNNAVGAARVTPYVQFQHDVSGSSPAPAGPFVDGRKAVTAGLGVNYLERWSADVSYTLYAGSANYLSDRDFVSLSLSYSF